MTTTPLQQPLQDSVHYSWIPMHTNHLRTVFDIANICHPDFPEAIEIFEDKLLKYPQGCYVLISSTMKNGLEIVGYAFTHPYYINQAPKLDTTLPDTISTLTPKTHPNSLYYFHDCAVLPKARGAKGPTRFIPILENIAQINNFTSIALISVNNSEQYWSKHGFRTIPTTQLPIDMQKTLKSYSDDAVYMIKPLDIVNIEAKL